MKKKIIYGLLGVVVVIIGGMAYLNYRNYSLSPRGSAELATDDLTVSLTYSRPSVRGRTIFGSKEQGALQPYGAYWRLGANESTEITFSRAVTFNGQAVPAGTYRAYAVPGPDSFEIYLNSELGKWGYFEPNHELDVLKTSVPVQKVTTPVEQHTIRLEQAESGIDMIFEWSDVQLRVPVR